MFLSSIRKEKKSCVFQFPASYITEAWFTRHDNSQLQIERCSLKMRPFIIMWPFPAEILCVASPGWMDIVKSAFESSGLSLIFTQNCLFK